MNALRSISPPTPRPLSGSLEQLSVPDLLQTAETNRRSGRIVLHHGGRTGTLWMRDGRVVDAAIEGGPRGREAAYEMVFWDAGLFEADFTEVAVTDRIFEPTSALLLEAMRLRDESLRDATPPHAAIPDPPPLPPRPLLALHRSLTLLNVAASSAAEHLEAEVLARRFEETRRETAAEHSALEIFRVAGGGVVTSIGRDAVVLQVEPDALVRGVSRWLLRLFAVLERALPGRFSVRRLRAMTEAVQDDLASLGFYRELGFETESGD
jgi:GNAT superfamily N-acetyltransferase